MRSLRCDAVVDATQELFGHILAIVNATVVAHKVALGHFLLRLDVGVVRVRVEHNDGVGEDKGHVRLGEHLGVALAVSGWQNKKKK